MVEQFTYAQLRVYLTGEKGKAKRVKRIKYTGRQASGPEIIESGGRRDRRGADEALLDLIDQIKDGIEITESIKDVKIPRTFDQIDQLLAQIYSGNASAADKKTFLSALYQSEHFYQRVLLKIGQLVPADEEVFLPSLSDIQIQSDEQILATMDLQMIGEEPAKIDLSYKIPLKFWENLKESLTGLSRRTKHWAYATSGLTLLLVTALGGLRFYHTTYQIMLAEDLLQENYRVYIAGTPRLSGGYSPTGIARLMGDNQEGTYLEKAIGHTNRAIDSESRSPRIQELQAQIFIITNDLVRAEQMFSKLSEEESKSADVLNDRGVLKYNQGQYESARQLFIQAIKVDPEISESYYNLALAQEKMGEIENAIISIEKFLAIEQAEAWQNAGENFYKSLRELN